MMQQRARMQGQGNAAGAAGVSHLQQRLQQQQQQQQMNNQMMARPGGVSMIQRPPNMSGGLMPRPGGPPPYIRGPSPMMNQGSPSMQPNQGPSPAGQYAHSPSNIWLEGEWAY